MKIALCLHGMFDSTQDFNSNGLDGFQHIKKHILDKGDVDVFIHSWEPEKRDLIEGMYNPKQSIFETQKDFSELIKERRLDTLQNCPRSPQVVLSKYDIIVKARFDLGRINRNTSFMYPVQCINFQTNIEQDKIYNANWNHFHMGPADMWFYGSPSVMVEFTSLFSFLDEQMKIDSEFHKFATEIEGNRGDLSNAIAFYKWWMIKNDLWDNKINLDTIWE
jgi:hypothetical protein